MKIKHAWLVLLLVALPGILLAQSNPTYEDVIVQKHDGWKYSHVSVVLANDGGSISILRTDGASLDISVGQVLAIFDANGNNITWQVIPPGQQEPKPAYDEFTISGGNNQIGESMTYQPPLPPRLFNAMISGGLGYGQPIGSFYDDLDPGLLYFGDVRFSISPLVYVKLAYRSQNLLEESVPLYGDGYDAYLGDAQVSVDARQYLVTFGFLNRPNSKNKLRAYAELGAGYADHVVKATFNSQSDTASEGRAMFVGAAGILVPFNKTVGMDFGLSLVTKLFNSNEGEGWGMLFSGQVGMTVAFGSE